MTPRQLKTNKLFYKKWPYKVCCIVNGAGNILRHNNSAKTWLMSGGSIGWAAVSATVYLKRYNSTVDPQELRSFFSAALPFLNRTDLQFRAEGKHFNIFCADAELLNQITATLDQWIIEIHSPSNATELDFMLENGHKAMLCDNLPHGRYMYKVIFKTTAPKELRSKFYDWSKNYGDRLRVSKNNTCWMMGTRNWVQNPFMHVEDSQLLTMVGMFMGDTVQSVIKFIPRDSINTGLEQEMLCQP